MIDETGAGIFIFKETNGTHHVTFTKPNDDTVTVKVPSEQIDALIERALEHGFEFMKGFERTQTSIICMLILYPERLRKHPLPLNHLIGSQS